MERTQISRTFGDECALYEVTDYKATTIGEFIQEVLKGCRKDWGYIEVGQHRCEYRYGALLSDLPEEIKQLQIGKVSGFGGWSRMDYTIYPSNSVEV